MDRNGYCSKKIIAINVILSILIVILHADCSKLINNNNLLYVFSFIRVISDTAVPTFFLISFYLLFQKYNLKTYVEKVKKRVKSLIIPYLFWSIILFGMFLLLSFFPSFKSLNLVENIKLDFINIVKYIVLAKSDPPIWFIRVLFLYVLISPIVYLIGKEKEYVSIILATIFIVLNLIFKFSYAGSSSLIFWMPLFCIAFYLSFFKKDKVENLKKNKAKSIIIFMIYIAIIIIVSFFDEKSNVYYIYRIISPFFLWFSVDILNVEKISNYKFSKYTFFTFCVHYPIIVFLKKLLQKIIPISTKNVIFIYIISILVTISIIYVVSKILETKSPKIWKFITGNRI